MIRNDQELAVTRERVAKLERLQGERVAQEARLKAWETLFGYALRAIDSVGAPVFARKDWSFGGGTVLMCRYRHRVSRDVDIFVPDPQYLAYLDPALNDAVDALTPRPRAKRSCVRRLPPWTSWTSGRATMSALAF